MTRLTFALSSFALSPSPPPSSSLSSPSQTLRRLTLPSFSREYISGGFSLTHSSHRLTRSILLAPSPASKHPAVRRFPARASVYSTPAIFQSHCCCCCFCPAIHLLSHPPPAQQTPLCLSARRLLVVACFGCRRSESHLLRKCALPFLLLSLSLAMYGSTARLCRLCRACMQPLCSLTGRHAVGRRSGSSRCTGIRHAFMRLLHLMPT